AQKVSFTKENASLKDFFNAIQRQTGYSFIVSSDLLKQATPINIKLKDTPLREALDKSFQNQPFEYVINKRTIIINRRKNFNNNLKTVQLNEVTGKIKDEKGNPLGGVSIRLKEDQGAATSDNNGSYKIRVPNQNAVIVYSFIGFVSQEVKVLDRKNIDIVLQ